MCVDNDGEVNGVLDAGDQIVRVLRRHDAGHVLYAYGGNAHFLELLDHLNVFGDGVHGAGGVGNGAGCHCPLLHGLLNGDLKVVGIIQGIENADDVNAVFNRAADKAAYRIVGIVLVAEDVLAAKQHLQLGIGHFCADLTETFPGILIQEAQADVKGGAAPAFHGVKPSLIHLLENGLKLVVGKSCRYQRLIRVTKHGFGKLDFLHFFLPW